MECPEDCINRSHSAPDAPELPMRRPSDKKRPRRGAITCSVDDSIECVMAAMMHTDLEVEPTDVDSFSSETAKRRRSSGLSSSATPRSSFCGADTSIVLIKEVMGKSCTRQSSFHEIIVESQDDFRRSRGSGYGLESPSSSACFELPIFRMMTEASKNGEFGSDSEATEGFPSSKFLCSA
eukprot:CAMPEP_0113681366 /NCGR_PEP_ID=MMETSP0038_2-20120614/11952_1 /TAXON_ID=2898 /ORGANISM="Cryptomonas paramecium" /LENGTH=179 /DNA_ID=CAMNT_0000600085 /DNA_START=112 /DNA_END=651 /DNA_ORIENTATION=- /assembly_acc=CAM_ASM_000170